MGEGERVAGGGSRKREVEGSFAYLISVTYRNNNMISITRLLCEFFYFM